MTMGHGEYREYSLAKSRDHGYIHYIRSIGLTGEKEEAHDDKWLHEQNWRRIGFPKINYKFQLKIVKKSMYFSLPDVENIGIEPY